MRISVFSVLERACPPVQRDNSRALASGVLTVQLEKNISLTCTTIPNAGFSRYGTSRAKDLGIWEMCYNGSFFVISLTLSSVQHVLMLER